MPPSPRLLIKLRPQTSLGAAAPRANLRPLFETEGRPTGLGVSPAAPAWYIAEVPEAGTTAWDAAHTQLSAALGLDDSAVVFAEPDLPQGFPDTNEANVGGSALAITQPDCTFHDQRHDQRPPGPGFAWHLRDDFSQLASARLAVAFSDPNRTRIAHIDTGYDPDHSARPARILRELERNFVDADGNPCSAADPNRRFLFDQSGHGTGTIGILAGQNVPQNNGQPLGGAPDADILPLRIANSVVLFFTSALAQAIDYALQRNCDVVSISMGGLPSAAWNDAVNAAYEAGICIVAASGDCFAGLPTRHVIYPARYHRVIAACGVMENGSPYYDLPITVLEGNWGPDSCMKAALAAYTPNTPWAKFGCRDVIDMDGAGTSASTPQIAAAVTLWYEKYKSQLPRDWRRVEAVRDALFRSAKNTDRAHFGNGILQASAALAMGPRLNLPKTPADNDSFAFFRVLTGLGLTEPSSRERMLNLELTQRYLLNPDMQAAVPDPAMEVTQNALKRFTDALIADPAASQVLRRAVAARYPALFGSNVTGVSLSDITPVRAIPGPRPNSAIPAPPYRRIRTYAIDPSLSNSLRTSVVNRGLLKVRWEALKPGPIGEYVEVSDRDEDGTVYDPVDLDDHRLLAQDGFDPAEGNPQFHQQMVYAVAMTTIQHFEIAMGRRVLWRHRINPGDPSDDTGYVPRLRIEPHAFRQENAFYDPGTVGLRFGYFRAAANDPGDHVPGSGVFSCLSHDIVAHETTHAILDGMHRRFLEATNLDVLAFHEGFADIVALMQHFTMRAVLEDQIARSRGDLESATILGSLAVQFGHATGRHGALREAIGEFDGQGVWHRRVPDPAAYQKISEPHARGALLVAAVFDAFLLIYKTRTTDLYRIYTSGTGILLPGAIHPDLVRRLASEAAKSAEHVLHICIRALDYVPPVDITFGEYLRGIITADYDFVPDDSLGYRTAFVEAFRRRGIYPSDLDTLSVETLRWQGVDIANYDARFRDIVRHLRRFADDCLYVADRKKLFERSRLERHKLKPRFVAAIQADKDLARPLGIDPDLAFEVHELRRAERTGPDGRLHPQVIVAITQQRPVRVASSKTPFPFYGGATLVIDLNTPELKYAIRKRIDHQGREQATAAFVQRALADPAMALLLDQTRVDRLAVLHSLTV
jgi:subtilisin family serine protease